MDTWRYTRVQALMADLRAVMSRISTADAVSMCGYLMRLSPPVVLEKYGLASPARQAFYLIASLCSTPEPSNGEQASTDDRNNAIALVRGGSGIQSISRLRR